MSDVQVWLAIFLMAVTAFFFRAVFFLVHDRVRLAPWLVRALDHVPPAVMAALVIPELISFDAARSLPDARLLAGAVAFAAAWFSRNLLVTVAVGMLALWGLLALGFQ